MDCEKCGNPDASGFFCNLCGAELIGEVDTVSESGDETLALEQKPRTQFRVGWLVLGVLAGVGWLMFMNTPIWGNATPFYILGLRESDFGIGGSPLSRYLWQIGITSLLMLALSGLAFYKALAKAKS